MARPRTIRLAIFFWFFCVSHTATAQVTLVGQVRIPGDAMDRSGLSGTLETGTPQSALGGFSAIEYSGAKNRYLVLSDRGAGDGAASFQCRFHEIEFEIGTTAADAKWELLGTSLLRSQEGRPYTGSLEPMRIWNGLGHPPSLDPEGIRYTSAGLVVISDEYGPSIDWFDREGLFRSSVPVPEHFRLSEKLSPPMTRGAFTNRGMEGLSLTPDGRRLVAVMQGPLVQDGRIEKNKCLGLSTRWLVHDLQTGKAVEWLYSLDDESTGVSEVLAVDDRRFLVLERDSKAGVEAKIKRIHLVDSSQATDVSGVRSLRTGTPEGHRSLDKKLLIDLMLPEYGLSGAATPEKPEGLAWGPLDQDGSRLLVVCFDNDFEPERESILLAFRIYGL